MKRNEVKQLADRSLTELIKLGQEMRINLVRSRLDRAVGKLANTSLLARLQNDLARVATVIKQKQLLGDSK